jgi:hypothetical protein
MKWIISIKHWQLFLITVLPAAIVMAGPLKLIINAIGLAFGLIWCYSIVSLGQKDARSLEIEPLNLRWFNLNVGLVPVLFFIIALVPEDLEVTNPLTILAMLSSVYFVIAMIQILVHTGKTFVMLEKGRPVKRDDYLLTVLLLFMFIVGIWILQPKANRLIGNKS